MDNTYNLLFIGELQPGFKPDNVIDALVKDLGLSVEKADKLVNAKRKVTVKRGLDKPKGIKLGKRLEQAGLVMKLVKNPGQQTVAKPVSDFVAPSSNISASKTQRKQSKVDLTPNSDENPYAAPAANLEKKKVLKGSRQHSDPQKLRAGHGWQWVRDAYGMFKEHPWAWMGAFFFTYFLIGLTSLVPFLGMFLSYIVMPVFLGGLMIGAHEQKEGGSFRFGHVFAGFSNNRNQLMLLGVLITLAMFVCFIPFLLSFGMAFFTGNFDPEMMSGMNISMFVIGGLISMGLSIPLYMAMWFAPSLVAINEHNAWSALKLSFQGCKRNMLPILVYSLVLMGIFTVVMALFGIGAAIVMPQLTAMESTFSLVLPVIAILLFVTVMMVPAVITLGLSVYTAYRDIYYS
jgi:hypothetical protein